MTEFQHRPFSELRIPTKKIFSFFQTIGPPLYAQLDPKNPLSMSGFLNRLPSAIAQSPLFHGETDLVHDDSFWPVIIIKKPTFTTYIRPLWHPGHPTLASIRQIDEDGTSLSIAPKNSKLLNATDGLKISIGIAKKHEAFVFPRAHEDTQIDINADGYVQTPSEPKNAHKAVNIGNLSLLFNSIVKGKSVTKLDWVKKLSRYKFVETLPKFNPEDDFTAQV